MQGPASGPYRNKRIYINFPGIKNNILYFTLLYFVDLQTQGNNKKTFQSKTSASKGKGKGKAIPLQAWTNPEGSRRLRLPDFKTIGT